MRKLSQKAMKIVSAQQMTSNSYLQLETLPDDCCWVHHTVLSDFAKSLETLMTNEKDISLLKKNFSILRKEGQNITEIFLSLVCEPTDNATLEKLHKIMCVESDLLKFVQDDGEGNADNAAQFEFNQVDTAKYWWSVVFPLICWYNGIALTTKIIGDEVELKLGEATTIQPLKNAMNELYLYRPFRGNRHFVI